MADRPLPYGSNQGKYLKPIAPCLSLPIIHYLLSRTRSQSGPPPHFLPYLLPYPKHSPWLHFAGMSQNGQPPLPGSLLYESEGGCDSSLPVSGGGSYSALLDNSNYPLPHLLSWVLSFITLLVLYSPVPTLFESHTQCQESPLKNPCPPCNLECSQEATPSRKPSRVNWMRGLVYPTLEPQATSPTPSEAASLLWSTSWGFARGLSIPIGSTSDESSSSCMLPSCDACWGNACSSPL